MRRRACVVASSLLLRSVCAPASGALTPPRLLSGHARVSTLSDADAWRRCVVAPLLPPAAAAAAAVQRVHSRFSHQRARGGDDQAPSSCPATPPSAAGDAVRADEGEAPPPAVTWVDGVRPAWVIPYLKLARVDAPAGTWLLLWPCAWSLALAAPPGALPDARLCGLFAAGAVLLRGAGCTVNDMWDADIDRRVARTRHRPLASGALSHAQALRFLALQLSAGLAILLQLNSFSHVVGASSLGLVFSYPLMKRVTHWPQAFLGLTFNWGALLGWAAAHGSLDWGVVGPLYGAGVAWTLVYDTIYAHQDAADDARVGVRSTALRFGDHTQMWLAGFSALTVAGLAAAGHAAGVGDPYYVGVTAAAAHLAWQLRSVDLRSRADCAAKFRSNVHLGAIVFAGAVAGKLTAASAMTNALL